MVLDSACKSLGIALVHPDHLHTLNNNMFISMQNNKLFFMLFVVRNLLPYLVNLVYYVHVYEKALRLQCL